MNFANESPALRIVHLTNSLRLNGTGHTNSTIDLAIAQAAAGHKVVLMCKTSDLDTVKLLSAHDVELIDNVSTKGGGSSRHHRVQLRNQLRQFDVIHFHTVRSMFLAARVGPISAWRRSIATIHNPHQPSTVLMLLCRRVVALSNIQRASILRKTLGICRPTVIRNGTLGTPRLTPISSVVPRRLDRPSVLFVGALHARKGLDVLMAAMPYVLEQEPNCRLYIVGNRDAPEFESLAVSLGVRDAVTFVGFEKDPRELMLSADVFVLPSRQEGFGNVLTEARECRVPIVATDVGGIPEALSAGTAGLLVSPEDPQALGLAIAKVLTDDGLASRLRAATQVGIDDLRTSRAYLEYDAVYRQLA